MPIIRNTRKTNQNRKKVTSSGNSISCKCERTYVYMNPRPAKTKHVTMYCLKILITEDNTKTGFSAAKLSDMATPSSAMGK
jgi:hypothetical protein